MNGRRMTFGRPPPFGRNVAFTWTFSEPRAFRTRFAAADTGRATFTRPRWIRFETRPTLISLPRFLAVPLIVSRPATGVR